ncbi:hypothetical protein [Alteriqipengyuania sp.]|uniref:hypothetical protein n=1 Tax=Alteriqipengyuania sp. TaxID=2800692 RepID=UPI00351234FD
MPWREIPPKWWAVVVGIAFGSLALTMLDGPKKGYLRTVVTAAGCAPLLCLFAGALLPDDTSLEIAALVGGVTALGGTALILHVQRVAPSLVTAGLIGIAESYLKITPRSGDEPPEITRLRRDGTPEEPDPEAERLAQELDEKDDER